jgi:hypothetical protein
MNSDGVSIVAAIEKSVMGGNRLDWKRSKTRNVDELQTVIRRSKVTLERETWDLPEFTFVSHNLRMQDAAGRQVDYLLGFLQPEVNRRLAKVWRVIESATTVVAVEDGQRRSHRAEAGRITA